MSNEKYSMTFSTGGLFTLESEKVARVFLQLKDWKKVREQVLQGGILQLRTVSSTFRTFREVSQRLELLTDEELALVVEGTDQERLQILWLAVCCRFEFIRQFAVEVLLERVLTLRLDLSHVDFDAFFNAKADWHPELDGLTLSTRNKLRQCLFRMLREADFVSASGAIWPVMLAPRVEDLVNQRGREWLSIYPAHRYAR